MQVVSHVNFVLILLNILCDPNIGIAHQLDVDTQFNDACNKIALAQEITKGNIKYDIVIIIDIISMIMLCGTIAIQHVIVSRK